MRNEVRISLLSESFPGGRRWCWRWALLCAGCLLLVVGGPGEIGAAETDSVESGDPPPAEVELASEVEDAPQENALVGFIAAVAFGGGRVGEDHLDTQNSFELEAETTFLLKHGIQLGAYFSDRFYTQSYLSSNVDPATGAANVVPVDEQLLDARLNVGYEMMSLFPRVGRYLDAVMSLGLRYLSLNNNVYSDWSGGLRVGLDVVAQPADSFFVRADAGWSMRFFGADENNIVAGTPQHFWDYYGGVGWDFPGRTKIKKWFFEVGWQGSVIVLDHATRNYNAAMAGIGMKI